MKKWSQNLIVLLAVISLLPMRVFAKSDTPDIVFMTEEEAQYYAELYFSDDASLHSTGALSNTDLGIFESDGRIMVIYSTSASGEPSELGIKQIMLEEKDGFRWNVLAKYDKMSTTDSNIYTGGFYFLAPVSGRTYKASGIHFAVIDGREYTKYANTGGFIFP